MKRSLAFVTIIAIALSIFCITPSAQGEVFEYYKSQLNADEQKLYDAFITAAKSPEGECNVPELSTIQYTFTSPGFTTNEEFNEFIKNNSDLKNSTQKLSSYFKNALSAATMDHTELYWLTNSKLGEIDYAYSAQDDKVLLKDVKIIVPDVVSDSAASIRKVNEKIKTIGATGTDVEKVKKIHDWLCDNVEYVNSEHSHDLYGSLFKGKAVCQGYAEAFKTACDFYNIKCVCVEGDAINSQGKREAHMWNYVLINNKWYAIDVTWDDQGSYIYYDYFLAGKNTIATHYDDEKFSISHISNGQIGGAGHKTFSYPTLSENEYPLDFNKPTPTPTIKPTIKPTAKPTEKLTVAASAVPTAEPTQEPTAEPTLTPLATPTTTPEVTQEANTKTPDAVETAPPSEISTPTLTAENMPPLITPPTNDIGTDGFSLTIILACFGIGIVALAAVIVIIIHKKR